MFSQLRWRKALRDLWRNKARTLLVVLSLAIGIATLGIIINTRTVLSRNMDREYALSNAASTSIIVPNGFDEDLVETIRRMPGVAKADGVRQVNLRIQYGPNDFINLDLYAFSDFDDLRLNKIEPDQGVWPPPKNEILLERSTLDLSELDGIEVDGDLVVKMASGKQRVMKVAGLARDINKMPAPVEGRGYGYVTLDTLVWLEEPRAFNRLDFMVAGDPLDKAHIWAVASQVEDKIEKSGLTTEPPIVPDPGEYPLMQPFSALIIVMSGLGILSLFGGGFLVINIINSLLTQQRRQIGVMKAIGAQTGQIAGIYLAMIFILAALSLLISLPLAAWGGSQLTTSVASVFNLELLGPIVPIEMLFLEAGLGFAVPFLAAFYPILAGVQVSVQEAISDYGMGGNLGQGFVDRLVERIRGLSRPVMLSIRNTFRRKGRLALTLSALTLSGAVFISAYNIRASLFLTLDNIFAYQNYDVIFYFDEPYRIAKTERNIFNVPDVTRVESFQFTGDVYRVKGEGERKGNNYYLNALPPENTAFRPPLIAGRWLRLDDQAVVVINDALLRDEPDIGLGDTVLFEIENKEVSLQVVGIVEEAMALPSLYMNYGYFAPTLGNVGRANGAWVEATIPERSAEVIQALESQFDYTGMRVNRIAAISDAKRFMVEHFGLITGFLTFAAILLAVVGGLGLMGTMSINVIERVREIGIMRAIGASDGAIQRIFVIEGIIVGLISWALSLVAALLPTKVLGDAVGIAFLETPLEYTFSIGGMVVWLVIVVVVSILACLVPAENASKIRVNELLAYE